MRAELANYRTSPSLGPADRSNRLESTTSRRQAALRECAVGRVGGSSRGHRAACPGRDAASAGWLSASDNHRGGGGYYVGSSFDTIPHPELLKCLGRRISDGAMLALLKQWLQMPVEESDGRGGKRRSNPALRHKRGTPQGAPISPLLSNLYMRRFVLGWKVLGYAEKFQACIVNYADDFVILCRHNGQQADEAMRGLMKTLKLTVNEDKTRLCRVPEERLEFLGYSFERCYAAKTGRPFLGTRPSRKKISGIIQRISQLTWRHRLPQAEAETVSALNALLRGWGNYFCLGSVSKAYATVDAHTRHRLRQWLCHKHKVRGAGTGLYPDEHLYNVLGLVRLTKTTRNLPWANA
jgi:RNA-directed DNA polymerase